MILNYSFHGDHLEACTFGALNHSSFFVVNKHVFVVWDYINPYFLPTPIFEMGTKKMSEGKVTLGVYISPEESVYEDIFSTDILS